MICLCTCAEVKGWLSENFVDLVTAVATAVGVFFAWKSASASLHATRTSTMHSLMREYFSKEMKDDLRELSKLSRNCINGQLEADDVFLSRIREALKNSASDDARRRVKSFYLMVSKMIETKGLDKPESEILLGFSGYNLLKSVVKPMEDELFKQTAQTKPRADVNDIIEHLDKCRKELGIQ